MLFYSFQFMLLFLPVVLVSFFYMGQRFGKTAACIFLVIASLVFYGYANPLFVLVLCASVGVNYHLGITLQKNSSKWLLYAGLLGNLGALGYFKYMDFFLGVAGTVAGRDWHIDKNFLPLGMSFYTFQQIAWLVDSYAGNVLLPRTNGFWRYALFVCFFPHLIAGPIVNHSEMVPQYARESTFKPRWSSLAIGLSIFIIGLSKKVILADKFEYTTSRIFDRVESSPVPFNSAWLAALCYTFQIYFDLSGYSDMAIGIARMFNIRLPMNFNSPFKSSTIIDLWKRWHMTMTRFFQTYVHVPLSISFLRMQAKLKIRGDYAIHLATFLTLLAIGFWHGANWTFIIFGAMQGCAIILCHLWRSFRKSFGIRPLPATAGLILTYLFFSLSCVIYRSENIYIAMNMYHSMLWPDTWFDVQFNPDKIALWALGALVCFVLPNTQQIMQHYSPVLDSRSVQKKLGTGFLNEIRWRPNLLSCVIILALSILSLCALLDANRVKEFIYFRF